MEDYVVPELARPFLNPPRLHRRYPWAPEGEGGFSQCWYPVCLASEIPNSGVASFDFLDGRVAVYRSATGIAQTVSAYCPHMGADLGCGDVIGETLRCGFHHWTFDADGHCLATRVGDPAPKAAHLFRFPTLERYGLIWAFNGEEALYDLPRFSVPDDRQLLRVFRHSLVNADPQVGVTGAFDMQHFLALHEIKVDIDAFFQTIEWERFFVRMQIAGLSNADGPAIDWRTTICGTNVIFTDGRTDGAWLGNISANTIRSPGITEKFMIVAVEKGESDEQSQQEALARLDENCRSHNEEAAKDVAILRRARFNVGAFTHSDCVAAAWIRHAKDYPRAHPSADYIR